MFPDIGKILKREAKDRIRLGYAREEILFGLPQLLPELLAKYETLTYKKLFDPRFIFQRRRLEAGKIIVDRFGIPCRVIRKERAKRVRILKHAGYSYRQIGIYFNASAESMVWALKPKGSRKGNCAECTKPSEALHFHHTNYQTDDGVYLCISCHAHKPHYQEGRKPEPSKMDEVLRIGLGFR